MTLVVDNVWSTVEGAAERTTIGGMLRFRSKGYRFTEAYRRGRWDGWRTMLDRYHRFPAGLVPFVTQRLSAAGHTVQIEDTRVRPPPHPAIAPASLLTPLMPHQEAAVTAAYDAGRGLIHHPVGSGKTLVLVELVRRCAVPSLILTHRKDLLHQLHGEFTKHLNIPGLVSTMGDGRWHENWLVIGTFQTINAALKNYPNQAKDFLESRQAVLVDEVHHLRAPTYEAVMKAAKQAFYRYGASATVFREGDPECVTPETRVLTADLTWVAAGDLKVGQGIVGFDDETSRLRPRRMHRAIVTATGRAKRACYRITLSTGESLVSTGEHRWLVAPKHNNGHARWIRTDDLVKSLQRSWRRYPPRIARLLPVWTEGETRDAGYLAGAFDGEGSIHKQRGRMNGVHYVQTANPMLPAVKEALTREGFHFRECTFTRPEWPNSMHEVALNREDSLRFLGAMRPRRLLDRWHASEWPRLNTCEWVEIAEVEEAGIQEIVTLSSSSETYLAEGFGAHNTRFKVEGWTGPVVSHYDFIEERQVPADVFIVHYDAPETDFPWPQDYELGVCGSSERNKLIAELVSLAPKPVLVLIERIDHGQNLARMLDNWCQKAVFIYGEDSAKTREQALQGFRDNLCDVLVSSVILDEGVDLPNIRTLVLAGGGKAPHRIIQRVGRGQRRTELKHRLVVFDFWDRGRYTNRHAKQRLKTYKGQPAYETFQMQKEDVLDALREGVVQEALT